MDTAALRLPAVLPNTDQAGAEPFVKVLSDSRGIGSISHRV